MTFYTEIHLVSIGFYLALSFYHLLIYLGRKNDKSNLYYSLILISLSLIIYCKGIYHYSPSKLWSIEIAIAFFSHTMLGLFIFLFSDYILCEGKFKKTILLLIAVLFTLTIVSVITALKIHSDLIQKIIMTFVSLPMIFVLITRMILYVVKSQRFKTDNFNKAIFWGIIVCILFFATELILNTTGISRYIQGLIFIFSFFSLSLFLTSSLVTQINNEHNQLKNWSKDLEKKVLERTNDLQIANQEKTTTFINLAHEIKTPLTVLNNSVNRYIKKTGLNEELQEIKYCIDVLLKDTVNFLDSEKLQRGQIFYNHEQTVNFSELLNLKIPAFGKLALNRDILITTEIEDNINIKADPCAIDRVINNILYNAIKYNKPSGSISVKLIKINNKTQFIVHDTGLGVSEEHQKNIFLPYFQVSHEKRNLQGIGMGLYITSEIIKGLEGSISVRSQIGKETEFIVVLPIEYNLQKNIDNVATSITSPTDIIVFKKIDDSCYNVNRYTILIVEDNFSLLKSLKDDLSGQYNVICAMNGLEALEKCNTTLYKLDIILSDIMMDEMNGYEFLKCIRQTKKYKDIPVIFLTARTSETESIEGLQLGAIDYIYKPFSMAVLSAKIRSFLEYNEIKNKLFESERYRTMGMLTASISHEIINPLSGIKGPLSLLEEDLHNISIPLPKVIWREIGFIKSGLTRIENTASTLRMLYHGEQFDLEPVFIKTRIDPVISLIKDKYKHLNVKYVNHISDDYVLKTNPTAISQIIVNLLTNAVDAIGTNSGDIIITAESESETDVIEVKDTGCGIGPEKISLIFDPLYTTKRIGAGTGIGLYIVKELVSRLNGTIEVFSKPGEGTTFRMVFKSTHDVK